MRTPGYIISVAILATWAAIAGAQVFQPALRLRQVEGLRKLGPQALRQLAESGNTEAMFLYAVQHMTHQMHETTNLTEIVQWFRKAADLGSGPAQAYMAAQAITGFNGVVDEPEALMWARKSADSGDLNGQFILAHFYRGGVGTPRNQDDEPDAILQRIADKNHGLALALAADRLLRDKTTPLDGVRAWDMAVQARENSAWTQLLYTMTSGHRQMEKPPADALGRYIWALDRAEDDNPHALHLMGQTFSAGEIAPVNNAKAFAWFKKAADAGHLPAWERLGYFYEKGLGVPADRNRAIESYRKAAAISATAKEALDRLTKQSGEAQGKRE